MWEFIKYCLFCVLMTLSASMGDVPKGMTYTHLIVGCVTMIVLLGLGLGILWIISEIVSKFRK